ncbi:Predicted exporter [Desulfuromusa kysingii]|uniref:Predicted exporter n=1 Tax=Desulfuromusa kysingii TaxID=37625 RepID=A0A1H3VR08_9BACT|nr:MMPL family transporter [Desulfuromusa kysingii]SDZ76548.1 Predicted exporter [Desulfuromusa kysingii]
MGLITLCYRRFQRRRGWLLLLLLILLALASWKISQLQIEESISAMLPDGKSLVAHDFQLLQQAPFARQLVIHLRADPEIDSHDLLVATDQLRLALPAELFKGPLSGPGEMTTSPLFNQLGQYLPVLVNAEDLQQIAAQLEPEEIDQHLAADLAQLLQPQGMVLKETIRRDPLQLEGLVLQKLSSLNPIPEVRLQDGHFLSRDGHSSLILADTPISMTDAVGSKALLDAFAVACQQLPDGIQANLISGHAYTLANAQTIQKDMKLVLLVSGMGILLLFFLFLRSIRALFVYLLPLFSMAMALVVTAAWFKPLSGITVGFGAVLLGITIDFGLHVYFALRYGRCQQGREQLLCAVSRPVLFGALTTLAAFAVLLSSALPGQRQLAIFAMAGIVTALLLALLVLPHFIGPNKENGASSLRQLRRHVYDRIPSLRIAVLLIWLGVVGFAAVQAQDLKINAELRQLSYLPPALQQAEQALGETWGNMRSRALVFASAPDLEGALELNEDIWRKLQGHGMLKDIVSLAPLLPSQQTQQQNLHAWRTLWQERQATVRDLLQLTGQKYGFADNAFDPFWERLNEPERLVTPELLERWGLEKALNNLLLKNDQGYQLLTLIPDQADLIQQLGEDFADLPGITLVSQRRFSQQLSYEIGADFSRFITLAGVAVLVLLVLLFRRIPEVLLALLPVLTGVLVMFGGMGWLGLEMNLFNVVASILIIGLGVDYGIFMVCHGQQEEHLASSRAILISGLTTLIGFGALVLAKHPALHSIGLTVLLGISAAVPTAVLVIPAFRPKRH